MIVSFLHNMTLIVTITFFLLDLRNYVIRKKKKGNFYWLIPVTVGLFSIVIMQEQFHVSGYMVDLRSIPLLIITYMFGFPTGILAAILPAIYRYYLGGAIPYIAIAVTVLLPVLIGAIFHRPENKSYLKTLKMSHVLLLAPAYYLINFAIGLFTTNLAFWYWAQISAAMCMFGTISCLIICLMVNVKARVNSNDHELKMAIMQKEAILNSASEVAIVSVSMEDVITSFNPGAVKMFGYSPEEVLNRESPLFLHDQKELEERAKAMSEQFQTPITAEEVIHYLPSRGLTDKHNWTLKRKDGTLLKANVILSPMIDGQGKVYGLLAVATDMTEEFRLREKSNRQFEQLEAQNEEISSQQEELQMTVDKIQSHRDLIVRILDANHEAVVLTDAQGKVQFTNRRMHQYFDFHPAPGESIRVICDQIGQRSVPENVLLSEQVSQIVSGSREEIKERFTVGSPEGASKHIELFASSIVNVREQSKEILFVFMDRTEQEQLDEMKNDLISVISHELRTPLSSILGFIEILLNREVSKDKQDKYLQIVHREANRLTALLNDFLDIQRMESGGQDYHFAPTDLTVLVTNITEQWQRKPHTIELDMPAEDLLVRGDSQKIMQVLHNLLSNAVKYSPGANKIHVNVGQMDDEIRIDVKDFGLGIPEKDIPRLFTKFFRVEHSDRMQIRGTGLGLSICKEIIQAHGGSLTVRSELGKGSTFTVHLKKWQVGA
jgi:PAS domain S-box-containing protein